MKRLPKNERKLKQEARSLGLVGPNLNRSESPRSKIIKSIIDSQKIHRSIKFASILLVGSSGAGKSSTIHHLLKNSGRRVKFTNTSENQLGTAIDLTVSTDYPQFQVKDLELHIGKLPATDDYPITKFHQEYPKFSGCKPNLVFIFMQSTDNRFTGPNSSFVKSLESVKKLNIVDQHYPNVVAILTNCCSLPRNEIEKWKETLENKKKDVQDIIQNVFKIATPVVLIENEYEDIGLQVDGNYTRLPDDTLQPENLYKASQEVLSKIKDRLGLVILDACLSKVDKSDQGREIVVHANDPTKCRKRCWKCWIPFCFKPCSECCQSPTTTTEASQICPRDESTKCPSRDCSSCFPSSALVRVKENDHVISKKMNEISVGDKVFSWDYKRHEVVIREVIMFAHHVDNIEKVEYLEINTEDGESITMSGNHLVMIRGRDKATMAKNVHEGDVLSFIDHKGFLVPKKVAAIDEVVQSGLFSPITTEGNIIVNNIVASCYCSISDQVFMKGLVKTSAHHVAHLFFLPMRVMYKLKVKWVGKLPENGSIHPYAKWLCKLNLPWTDKELKVNI